MSKLVIKRGDDEQSFSLDLDTNALCRISPDGTSEEVHMPSITASKRKMHGSRIYSIPNSDGELGAGVTISMNTVGELVLSLDAKVCCTIDKTLHKQAGGDESAGE
jgi:hypothetical protein